MIKGDKIKLVKPMGVFKNVGEVCEVIDITEGGVISFKFGGVHLGCMSYDEYEKYFEKVEEAEKPKRVWTDWTHLCYEYTEEQNNHNTKRRLMIGYRENGKKVQVRYRSLRAESSCHKDDKFDFEYGLKLAKLRLFDKIINSKIDAMLKG